MRIGEAAAAAGLTTRAVRYYEERGLIAARRSPAGHREYDELDVRRLRALRELLSTGLTIADVRDLVAALESVPPGARPPGDPETPCALPALVVGRRLAELDARIERLTRLRDGLARRVSEPLRALARARGAREPSPRTP
ncbi:MerR family transcriptional regulator [Streptomyces hoynatensis]|uniref:MerR family transcriptional regulator n=1 Tax=Streptomyces hoynatensis TaxID=1141874 RepID=A0A3A9Z0D6_9ACTN|nr:MerR family transcriptional regulator [Streptomyces hoynatensis]RKN41738.1 MerR family transcriptional regulator [Streptomyces hoynatensis]